MSPAPAGDAGDDNGYNIVFTFPTIRINIVITLEDS
ncbi:hypothetical protein OI25_7409 [Paraburkholderia fungorum]|uniref:Uncharacterized protein n=1 Tax=Paraburkholderia fungorum TaxID=134537 RepID=A0AAU8T5E7_9BURK|nr:hypothetical protein OI25_7409 [Paraburkholderia fungorum]